MAAIFFGLVGVLVACSEDGEDQTANEQPAETAPPETAPPETDPPETEAPAETAPSTDTDSGQTGDDGLSTEEWILIGGLAIVVVAVIAGVTTGASRRSAAKAAAGSEQSARLNEIVGASRWIHDSGSVEILLAADPAQAQSSWLEVRRRMVDLEGQISTMAAGTTDVNLERALRNLAQAVADLRGAEEAHVSTKLRLSDTAGNEELVTISEQTVNESRQRLQAAIEPVAIAARN